MANNYDKNNIADNNIVQTSLNILTTVPIFLFTTNTNTHMRKDWRNSKALDSTLENMIKIRDAPKDCLTHGQIHTRQMRKDMRKTWPCLCEQRAESERYRCEAIGNENQHMCTCTIYCNVWKNRKDLVPRNLRHYRVCVCRRPQERSMTGDTRRFARPPLRRITSADVLLRN